MEELQNKSAKYISDLINNQNIECVYSLNKIQIEKKYTCIELFCTGDRLNSKTVQLQLEVNIFYGIIPIVESFVGIGDDYECALLDAIDVFKNNVLETFLSLIKRKNESDLEEYFWGVNKASCKITFDGVYTKEIVSKSLFEKVFKSGIEENCFESYKTNSSSIKWMPLLKAKVGEIELEEGLHWLRFFQAHSNKGLISELLINNKDYTKELNDIKFIKPTKSVNYYSARVFMLLQNGKDFNRIAKIICCEEDYDKVHSLLGEMGLSELEIEKVYSYIPEACGIQLIKQMGIELNYSEVVTIINEKEEYFECDLRDEELFNAAVRFSKQTIESNFNENLKRLAFMSATFNSVNKALNDGIQIKDINGSNFKMTFSIPSYI